MVVAQPHLQAAFLWAERLAKDAIPYGTSKKPHEVEDALDAYRQIIHRYGALDRAKVGIGDCLFQLGHYRESANAYPLSRRGKIGLALERAEWAEASKKLSGGRRVLMVSPVPGRSDRWIALFAAGWSKPSLNPGESWDRAMFEKIGLQIIEHRGSGLRPIGKEIRLQGDVCRKVGVYVVNRSRNSSPAVVAYREFFGGDSDPNAQNVFQVTASGLQPIQSFKGSEPVRILPATPRHNLRLVVTAAWHIPWEDVYEWDGRRFRFANRKNPGLYPLKYSASHISESKYEYPAWLELACLYMINGKPKAALRALRSAEWTCRMLVSPFPSNRSVFRSFDHYGDARENLKEIRRRIDWLRNQDYDHPLLYRPYDFNLQVPPYRLGKS